MARAFRVGMVMTWVTVAAAAHTQASTWIAKGVGDEALAALHKPVSFEFVDTALSDVVAFLRDQTGVGFVLDPTGLESLGIEVSEPVSIAVKEIELKLALDLILSRFDMDYLVRGDLIVITDSEQARERQETRVYPVLDLVQLDIGDGQRAWLIEEMIEVVQESVDPTCWEVGGGDSTISFVPATGAFAIRASQPTHRQIAEFFEMVRSSRTSAEGYSKEAGVESMSSLHAQLVEEMARLDREQKSASRPPTLEDRREKAMTETAEAEAERAKIELEKAKLELEQKKPRNGEKGAESK